MPFLVRPEEVTPGKAYWYASVCGGCAAGCGILAKGRDGRPIKLEGNPEHPLSGGGLCAIGQASVVGLYDARRLRNPLRDGQGARWAEVDREIGNTLASLRSSGGSVRFLTDSVTGPAEREAIASFLSRFQNGRHVTYDPISTSAIADAHLRTHGARFVPRYRFERAETIVGLEADFLGPWISPMEHTAGYRAGRRIEEDAEQFSHHVQFESRMTLTGSNADRRIAVPAGAMALIAAWLADELAKLSGSRDALELAARLPDRGPRDRRRGEEALELTARQDAGRLRRERRDGAEADQLRKPSTGQLRRLRHGVRPSTSRASLPSGTATTGNCARCSTRSRPARWTPCSSAASTRCTTFLPANVWPRHWSRSSWSSHSPSGRTRPPGTPASSAPSRTSWNPGAMPNRGRPGVDPAADAAAHRFDPAPARVVGRVVRKPAKAYDILRASWRSNVFPRRAADAASTFDAFWNRALHDGFVRSARSRHAGWTTPFRPSSAVTAPAAERGGGRRVRSRPSSVRRHAGRPSRAQPLAARASRPDRQDRVGQLRGVLAGRGREPGDHRQTMSSGSRPASRGRLSSFRRWCSPASTSGPWPSPWATGAREPIASRRSDPSGSRGGRRSRKARRSAATPHPFSSGSTDP